MGEAIPRSNEDASAYFASIGPWYSAAAVREYCAISEETLERWRVNRLVLAVEFADGQHYYPAQQFADGRRVRGLAQVLDLLEPAYGAPETRAAWLAGPAYENESQTQWELLRAGELGLVLRSAVEDVARVLGR